MVRWFLAVAIAALACAPAQSGERTAREIVNELTYQSGREMPPFLSMGLFTCGSYLADEREDRQLTLSLVKLGESAIPEIEAALSSTAGAFQARWLLLAYAQIRGPSAYDHLRIN